MTSINAEDAYDVRLGAKDALSCVLRLRTTSSHRPANRHVLKRPRHATRRNHVQYVHCAVAVAVMYCARRILYFYSKKNSRSGCFQSPFRVIFEDMFELTFYKFPGNSAFLLIWYWSSSKALWRSLVLRKPLLLPGEGPVHEFSSIQSTNSFSFLAVRGEVNTCTNIKIANKLTLLSA